MKKPILSCLLMLCAGTMMAETNAIFAKVGGTSTCYLLDKQPQVTFADNNAVLTIDETKKLEVPLTNGAALEVTFGEFVGYVDCSVTSVQYATIYSDEKLVVPANVEVYAPTYDETNNTLKLGTAIKEGVLAANKGYIVKAAEDNYQFTKTTEEATAGSGSCLIGSVVDTPVESGKTYFALANKNGVGFFKYSSSTLKGGKAYLALNTTYAAKLDGILFDEGGTTAINNVTMDENGQYIIYDLNGRRVTKMEKGQIYVIGNKKYLIK